MKWVKVEQGASKDLTLLPFALCPLLLLISLLRLTIIRHMLQSKYTDLKIQAFARKLPKSTFELLQK